MPLADYAHWNEDAEYMWWHEEGKHPYEPSDPDPQDQEGPDEFYECQNAPKECMQYGNFDWEQGSEHGDDVWSCSSCGTLFRIQEEPWVVTPLEVTA